MYQQFVEFYILSIVMQQVFQKNYASFLISSSKSFAAV